MTNQNIIDKPNFLFFFSVTGLNTSLVSRHKCISVGLSIGIRPSFVTQYYKREKEGRLVNYVYP